MRSRFGYHRVRRTRIQERLVIMYVNLDLQNPSQSTLPVIPANAGDNLEYTIPNTKSYDWKVCKLDLTILQGDAINNYDIRVLKKQGGIVKSVATSYEEHESVSFNDISVIEENDFLKILVTPQDNEPLELLVGNIRFY